jgi:hypothetical protein
VVNHPPSSPAAAGAAAFISIRRLTRTPLPSMGHTTGFGAATQSDFPTLPLSRYSHRPLCRSTYLDRSLTTTSYNWCKHKLLVPVSPTVLK